MIDSKLIKKDKIYLPNVSRETLMELEDYSKSILNRNKKINLISSSTEKSINSRHIYDSAQTIDFSDKKDIKVFKIFKRFFNNRKIITIDCSKLIWGFGAVHCMTQQEPDI